MAAADETNLSTPQPAAQTHTRLSGANGDARRTQRAQAPSRQGPQTAGHSNTSQTAGLRICEPGRSRLAFARSGRLHRRTEYLYVQREGVRVQTAHFVVYAARFCHDDTIRLGTAVSRRVGGAVVRNRLKRRIRECFRLQLRCGLPGGTGVVVIGRRGAGALLMRSVMRELDSAVGHLRPRLSRTHE